MKPRLKRVFLAALAVARAYAANRRKAEKLLDAAERKRRAERGPVGEFTDQLNELTRLVRAWLQGRYRVVPWKTITVVLASLLYFVNPFDLLPDFVPLLGFTDDASVVAFVLASIQKDMARFRDWELENARYGVATFPD
jgi:uncharacterized membrane protein YkvA (DUF1232 family)